MFENEIESALNDVRQEMYEFYMKFNSGTAQKMSQYFDYNVYGGKYLRIKLMLELCNAIDENKSNEELWKEAMILGICVHIFVTASMVIDDIMDKSLTRRDKVCWYILEPKALLYARMSLSYIYTILKKNFKQHELYARILNTFLPLTENGTNFGQKMDSLQANVHKLDDYTMSRYEKLVLSKTALCTFILPVRLWFYLLKLTDRNLHLSAESICGRLGVLFQAQDDYMDVFVESEKMGKIGTDIRNGKCTWLVVSALPLMNFKQQQEFKAHFGKQDDACVNIVKEIFAELKMPEKFEHFETNELKAIKEEISGIDVKFKQIKQALMIIPAMLCGRKF